MLVMKHLLIEKMQAILYTATQRQLSRQIANSLKIYYSTSVRIINN